MTYELTSLKNYYFLRKYESFSIDPWRDGDVYFGDTTLKQRITRRIDSDFEQPRRVPKFFVFGAYGSGKTHTLANIAFSLSQNELHLTEPVYLAMPPLTSKERWIRIHSRLLDALSPERIQSAVEIIADEVEGPDKIRGFLERDILLYGDDTLKVSQANIFRNFLFGGKQSQLSWEWLKGRKNTPDQATMLGIQKDLGEATDLVDCLLNLGVLYHRANRRKIVFLLDEAEAVRSVTNADAEVELQHMFRLLLDNNNTYVGLVLAVQSEQHEIPPFFLREDLMRRVDYDQGYIDLGAMVSQVNSAKEFVKHVLAYLVDQDKAEHTIATENLSVSKELFPFTDHAVDAISTHVAEQPEHASPSFILATMSSAAIEGWRRRNQSTTHVVIDPSIIEETVFPGS
ncbi:MAG: hypothetical protein ACLFVA_04015 [Dehalococcoidia bacterium]